MIPPSPPLPTRYQIASKLGSGGMGDVYLADDQQLGRRVAVKILPTEFALVKERLLRFQREARAACAVSHPGIAHIYELGECGGTHFIAMEYVEGVTLAARIAGGPLPVQEALDIALQVADALEAAHAAGIIHRDIKPANLLLGARNRVKILDFGIAKLDHAPEESAADHDAATVMQTSVGSLIGTGPYMSPEQVLGREIDGRSDLFSLGAVMYEMLTGRPPFRGASATEVLAKVLSAAPPEMDGPIGNVPAGLQRVVRKCLEKDLRQRYQNAGELTADLGLLRQELGTGRTTSLTRSPLPPAAAGEAGPAHPARRNRRRAIAAVLALALTAVGAAFWFSRLPAPRTVAVIPFRPAGAESLDFLADGITAGLIYDLSRIPEIRVTASSLVRRFRRADMDPVAAGKELRVQSVLTGSVSQEKDSLLVRTELIDVSSGTLLWAQEFRRSQTNLTEVQPAIREAIMDRLRVRLGGDARRRLDRQYATKPSAYRPYLQARHQLDQRTPEGIAAAIGLFQKTIVEDPAYAPAYAGLAECQIQIANSGSVAPLQPLNEARAAAERALELDDSLAEAHTILALVRTVLDFDWEGAERAYRRAIELNPQHATAHAWYANLLLAPLGRREEAISFAARAVELEPGAVTTRINQAAVFHNVRQQEEAIERLGGLLAEQPEFIPGRIQLAYALSAAGRDAEALAGLPDSRHRGVLYCRAYLHARLGQEVEALRHFEQAERIADGAFNRALDRARPLVALGRADEAIALLAEAVKSREPGLVFLPVLPAFDPLRDDARFV
ncbi:MAG: protein kinase domain-containing protein, partial [Limisphaerales bacterium]